MKTTIYRKEKRKELPATSGVYRFIDENGEVLYIGKSVNIKTRINSYFQNRTEGDPRPKLQRMQRFITYIEVTITPTELEAEWLEQALIERHHPQYNQQMKSNSCHGYLILESRKTTWGWKVVSLTEYGYKEKVDKKGALHIGPFRNPKTVKNRLNILRNVNWLEDWSYQPIPVRYSKEDLSRALQWIKGVLGSYGNCQVWLEALEKQRDQLAEVLQFEKARYFQEVILCLRPVVNALKRNQLLNGNNIPFMIDRKNDWCCGYYFNQGKLYGECWEPKSKNRDSEYNDFIQSVANTIGSLETVSSFQEWEVTNLDQEMILYRAFSRQEEQVIGCLLSLNPGTIEIV